MMRSLLLILALFSSLASAKDEKLVALETRKAVALHELRSDATMFVFWASWCKGCSENIASFLGAADKDLLAKHIRGISVDESTEAAASYFVSKPHLTPFKALSYLDAGGEWAAAQKLDGLPAVMILNGKGERLRLWMGVMKPEEIQEALKILAAEVKS